MNQEELSNSNQLLVTPMELLATCTHYHLQIKEFRTIKHQTEKELTEIIKRIIKLKTEEPINQQQLLTIIQNDKHQLINLKRKLSDSCKEQNQIYDTCKKRLHREEQLEKEKEVLSTLSKKEDKRQLDQHLYKQIITYFNCRNKISQSIEFQASVNLEDRFQLETQIYSQSFQISSEIEQNSLQNVEQWCYRNSHMLHKIHCPLQFNLLCCRYINMLKCNDSPVEACMYLRRGLKQDLKNYALTEDEKVILQKLTSMLLVEDKLSIKIQPYLHLTKNIFFQAVSAIYSIDFTSSLQKKLAVGVASLKTICCHRSDLTNPLVCPICEEKTNQFGKNIPILTKNQSKLKCRINKSLMDEENYPVALPNGQIYSISGLAENEVDEKYYCPTTQTFYPKKSGRKIFLA